MGTSLNGLTPAGTYPGLIKTGDNAPIDGTLKTLSDGNGNNLPMEASTTAVNFTGTLTQAGATLQPTLVSGTNIKTINGTSLLGSGNIPVVTSPSGVAGAIQFSNGSAFASDAANLFWDDANNRLGIGTATPTSLLNLSGSSEATPSGTTGGILNIIGSATNALVMGSLSTTPFGLYIQGGGSGLYPLLLNPNGSNVGIATTNPTAKLHIVGSGSTSATTSLLVQNSAGTNWLQVKDDGDITNGVISSADLKFEISPVANKFFRLTRQGVNVDFSSGSAGNAGITVSGTAIPFNVSAASANLNLSNGGVRVGSSYATTNASAQLEVVSTTKGFLPPRMTTTQKNAIATPAAGLVVYDSTTNKLCCYNGSTWNDLF